MPIATGRCGTYRCVPVITLSKQSHAAGEVIKTGDFKAVHGEGMPQYRCHLSSYFFSYHNVLPVTWQLFNFIYVCLLVYLVLVFLLDFLAHVNCVKQLIFYICCTM
jgi:hypothetical protein